MNSVSNLHLGNFYHEYTKTNKVALIFKNERVTYKELDYKVRQYMSYLKNLGITKGDVVALSAQNSFEFVYSYFSIVSLGATVVPLNLMLTFEEIGYILKDSNAKAVILNEKIFDKFNTPVNTIKEKFNLKHVVVTDEATKENIHTLEPSEIDEINPDSVSTLLYTSGTTGKPKGAMLTHKNLLSNANSSKEAIAVTGDDVFQCVLPMFHTFGFTVTVLLPLYIGASMVIHETFLPKEVISSLEKDNITVFSGVPAMFVVLTQALKEKTEGFPKLRIAISGGAPLPVEILNTINHTYNIPLVEGYGLTEASPVVSFSPLKGKLKPGSVGLSIPDVFIEILDDTGNLMKQGEIGEIAVKGPNVMKGYIGNAQATADTFKDGWLLTGDIGYIDEDGYVFIVDRKKDLIITRGLNVYPREIEEVLYQHPSVLEAAVIGVKDSLRGEVIKAFISLKEGHTADKKELLEFLKPKIASYKMPKTIEIVDSLPKNGTGKILKRELR